MPSIRVKSERAFVTKQHSTSTFRVRFNWRLWVVLGALTELFLIYVARWWAPSPVTYFLAVLFLPGMVLTRLWSFKYFKVVKWTRDLCRRADQNLQELSHFFEVATAVSNLTKLGEDLGTLTTKLAELLDVEMCGFFLYQDGLEALIAPAAPSGMRESRLFNQMRLNQLRFGANASTLIGRVFTTQQPTIIADCLHDIEAGQLLPQTFGYRDLLLVPLGSGGRPLGVLMLANKRHGEFSSNYDVKLAASLGAEVAVSLENTFLFEQTRQQAQRLDASMEMLRQVSQALTATTVGPTALLQGVAQALIGVSGAVSCLITLTQSGNPELQQPDRMKSEFLPTMSHELRTPLNAIIGFSEIIQTTPELSQAERAEFAETIHNSGRQLLSLINDILDLTHIQAGRLELHPAPCLIAEAVDAALSGNAAAAGQKGLTVTSQVDRTLQVVFDARSLRHIVHNLVNNAVKFTSHHGSRPV